MFLNCYLALEDEQAPEPGPTCGSEEETRLKQETVGPTLLRRPNPAHSRCTDMKDPTTNPVIRKTPRDLLLRGLSAIGSKIFRADDCRAHDHGWQITPRHGGLSRSYRDPRFDYLVACTACNGHGSNPSGVTCSGCNGTGRIVLDPADVSRPGRGQP